MGNTINRSAVIFLTAGIIISGYPILGYDQGHMYYLVSIT